MCNTSKASSWWAYDFIYLIYKFIYWILLVLFFLQKFQELSSDDYFSKNNEFATWLKEEKDMFFSELSSESARHLFTDFVKDWNNKKLDTRYYEGISSGPRSAHNWTFKS